MLDHVTMMLSFVHVFAPQDWKKDQIVTYVKVSSVPQQLKCAAKTRCTLVVVHDCMVSEQLSTASRARARAQGKKLLKEV